MRSLKNTVESTPAVWVHGVISQIAEKPSGVYLSIADFADGDVKPKATLALYCYTPSTMRFSPRFLAFRNRLRSSTI